MDAILEAVVEFVAYVAVMFPFPVPDGVTAHHAASLTTVQVVFEITSNAVVPAFCVTL